MSKYSVVEESFLKIDDGMVVSSHIRVLAFNRFFSPGYRAGGPIVSLENLVEAIGDRISFALITTDRDLGDEESYAGLPTGKWVSRGNSIILYLPQRSLTLVSIETAVREIAPETVYLNSFFDPWFTARVLLLRRLGRLPKARLVLAPRGEFSPGALGLKPFRKRLYIAALRAGGLLRNIDWHASTTFEAKEIEGAIGPVLARRVHVAPDLGALPDEETLPKWAAREPETPLRICFFSRVSPKKNLLCAIEALGMMKSRAILTVVGPIEDQAYWEDCKRKAAGLPSHVSMFYGGTLTRDCVHNALVSYDVFFLPTLGENYGHVIPEALSVGLPVVISDRTPWRGMAGKGVGYDGPVDPELFARELDRIASLDVTTMIAMRKAAREFAEGVLTDPEAVEANRRLFDPAL